MASWLFGGCTAVVPIYFDIRLENGTIWTPSDEEETNYSHLNGTIVLCLKQALPVTNIKLHMKGSHFINWTKAKEEEQYKKSTWCETTFYHQIWSFLSHRNTSTLYPGNHEFPFTITIRKDMPESIEGLKDCFIRYELTATIVGSRELHKKSQRISVSKRPNPCSLVEPLSIEKLWPEKIRYEISIPGSSFLVGQPIAVDVRYIPLRKGVSPVSIKIQLLEYQVAKCGNGELSTRDRLIAEDYSECDSDFLLTQDIISEWFALSRTLTPVKQLEHCLPSCQSSFVEISHMLRVFVQLQNPQSNISQITACFSISLYTLPQTGYSSHASQSPSVQDFYPPPSYETHTSDKRYFDSEGMDLNNLQNFLRERASGSESTTEVVLNDLSEAPCYDMAMRSGVPCDRESPQYWGIVRP